MKKLLIFILLFPAFHCLFAQPDSGTNEFFRSGCNISGSGGPGISVFPLSGSAAVLAGGQGGMVISDNFIVGGGGYGLVNKVSPKLSNGNEGTYSLGYGGFLLGYAFPGDKIVHPHLSVLMGWGGVEVRNTDLQKVNRQEFFILNPRAGIELNITAFLRVIISAEYRWITDFNNQESVSDDIKGPGGNITLWFGYFQ